MIYNRPGENENLEDTPLYQNLMRNHPTAPVIREFLTMLAICHTVIPEVVEGKINYHAASPGGTLIGLPDTREIRECPGILPLVPCPVVSAYSPGF